MPVAHNDRTVGLGRRLAASDGQCAAGRSATTATSHPGLVAIGTASIGVVTAWLVVGYDFPLRRTMSWALVLPLAVPPYLAAYAFAEFFHYAGPVQTAVRAIFGFTDQRLLVSRYQLDAGRCARDVVGALPLRLHDGASRLPDAGTQHRRRRANAWRFAGQRCSGRILLPVARPAIVAGVALVLMETLNDIGASEYLGVRTLTFSVYSTWLNRGSLEGAAQIATLMLASCVCAAGRRTMGEAQPAFPHGRATQIAARPRARNCRMARWLALHRMLLPVLAGFGIPALFVSAAMRSRRIEHCWTRRSARR
jgi:iron(III) transport system permease protein